MYRVMCQFVLGLVLCCVGVASAQESNSPDKTASSATVDPSGTWKWERTFGDNQMNFNLNLSWDNRKVLTGTLAVNRDEREGEAIKLEDVKLAGDKLTFVYRRTWNDQDLSVAYEGIVSDTAIKGLAKAEMRGELREFDWEAKRAGAAAATNQWTSLFDGETLNGWERVGNADSVWEVKDGAMTGSGPPSMLVNTSGPYKNFRYRAEIKINDGGNSGLYFRTTRKPGFTDGYEAQIDSTHRDPIRTGSLYGMCHVYQRLVEPDTWFTYELEVRDDVWRGREMTRIKITVDGNELYEYLDFALTFKDGYFAFQHHDPGSHVSIRKVEVMPLP